MDLSELSNNPEQVKQLILILQELLSKQGSSIAKVPTKPKAQKNPNPKLKISPIPLLISLRVCLKGIYIRKTLK